MLLQNFFQSPITTLIGIFVFIIAIAVHEFSHALAADYFGDETPSLQGRLTLNPLAHLDLVGSIGFLLFGFGWGKPVQYNPLRLSRRVDELMIALAGPASNILLALVFNLLGLLLNHVGASSQSLQLIGDASYINVWLAAFNMIPLPPLDGSSIVAYFWPPYRSVMGGQIGLLILLLLVFSGSLLSSITHPFLVFFTSISHLFGLI